MRAIEITMTIALVFSLLVVPTFNAIAQEAGDNISGTGTVTFIEVEGGFYGIVADDGSHYRPLNLSQEFKVNGTRVFFEMTVADEQASIFMWGTAVEINSIEKLLEIGDNGSATGTVRYIPEDDTYGIITDDGLRFLPTSIPDELGANGTYIQFDFEVTAVNAGSLWGTEVTITNAELTPQSCTSCNSYWWAYSLIIVVLAAFIIFKILRRRREGGGGGEY